MVRNESVIQVQIRAANCAVSDTFTIASRGFRIFGSADILNFDVILTFPHDGVASTYLVALALPNSK
jgi:hypothetical protein